MTNAYDTDGFKTLVLRTDKGTRTAFCEGLQSLHYGDAITVVVSGVQGCVPANLVFGIYDAESNSLADVPAAFAFVPGCVDKVYANISLHTTEAATAVTGKAPGEATEVRLYLYETGGKTWLDTSANLYPNPAVAGGGGTPSSCYVTCAELAAAVAPILTMPTLNAVQREARFNALLAALSNLAT